MDCIAALLKEVLRGVAVLAPAMYFFTAIQFCLLERSSGVLAVEVMHGICGIPSFLEFLLNSNFRFTSYLATLLVQLIF